MLCVLKRSNPYSISLWNGGCVQTPPLTGWLTKHMFMVGGNLSTRNTYRLPLLSPSPRCLPNAWPQGWRTYFSKMSCQSVPNMSVPSIERGGEVALSDSFRIDADHGITVRIHRNIRTPRGRHVAWGSLEIARGAHFRNKPSPGPYQVPQRGN